MEKVVNPHDKFVRETLSDRDVARDFLGNYLPDDILEAIDLDTIEISKDSFIESDLKAYHSDLLYKILIRNEPGYIYLLLEHKSREDKLVAVQLLGYILNIWKLHLKQGEQKELPVVIPLVLYHGRQTWSSGIRLSDLLSSPKENLIKYIPDFEFVLCDLTRYTDNQIKGNILARVFVLLLKHIRNPELREKLPDILSLFFELELQETGLKTLETYLTYLFSATDDVTAEAFMDIVEKSVPGKKGGAIMNLAEQFFEKGRIEGERKGMIEGERKGMIEGERKGMIEGERIGMIESIELSIGLKFGEIDPRIMSRIKNIQNVDRLKEIFKRIQLAGDMSEIKEMLK